MTADQARKLLAVIEELDASESFSRAIGWTVVVHHMDTPECLLGVYGSFCEPAAALEYAATQEGELNEGEETGFRCQVHPIMPVT